MPVLLRLPRRLTCLTWLDCWNNLAIRRRRWVSVVRPVVAREAVNCIAGWLRLPQACHA